MSHTAVSCKQKDISTAGRNQYCKYGSWIHNIQSQSFFCGQFRLIICRNSVFSPELITYQTQFTIDQISNWIIISTVSLAIVLILFALKNYMDTYKLTRTQTYSTNDKSTICSTTAKVNLLNIFVLVYPVIPPSNQYCV